MLNYELVTYLTVILIIYDIITPASDSLQALTFDLNLQETVKDKKIF